MSARTKKKVVDLFAALRNCMQTKHDNHTCRDESPQLGNNAAVDPVTSENDGLGPNHVDARKET